MVCAIKLVLSRFVVLIEVHSPPVVASVHVFGVIYSVPAICKCGPNCVTYTNSLSIQTFEVTTNISIMKEIGLLVCN